ncbi:MAG: hypothetical protein R6V57_20300 [Vicinamibacterales bacterium]
MTRNLLLTALAGVMTVASLAASPAEAGPLYFREYGLGVSGLEFQVPFWMRNFAGELMVDHTASADTSDDFAVFCVDIANPKSVIQDVVIRPLSELPDNGNPSNVQPDAGERVAWLLNQYGTDQWLSTDGNLRAAALQIAIWEVLYDSFGGYDVTGGTFRWLYATTYTSLYSYTTSYLTALGNNRSEALWYDVNLEGAKGQDFARTASVPDTGGTMMLLASGLAGLGWFARRRPRH